MKTIAGAVFMCAALSCAACSSSSKPTSAPVASPTTVEGPSTSAAVDYGAQYERLVAPVVAAEAGVTNTTEIATLKKQLAPVATSIRTFDRELLAHDWPESAKADVKALVVADGASVDDLESLDGQTVLSIGSWTNQLRSDFGRSTAASEVVRSDLGLPPKD